MLIIAYGLIFFLLLGDEVRNYCLNIFFEIINESSRALAFIQMTSLTKVCQKNASFSFHGGDSFALVSEVSVSNFCF